MPIKELLLVFLVVFSGTMVSKHWQWVLPAPIVMKIVRLCTYPDEHESCSEDTVLYSTYEEIVEVQRGEQVKRMMEQNRTEQN